MWTTTVTLTEEMLLRLGHDATENDQSISDEIVDCIEMVWVAIDMDEQGQKRGVGHEARADGAIDSRAGLSKALQKPPEDAA